MPYPPLVTHYCKKFHEVALTLVSEFLLQCP
jgi:hypothetical protein